VTDWVAVKSRIAAMDDEVLEQHKRAYLVALGRYHPDLAAFYAPRDPRRCHALAGAIIDRINVGLMPDPALESASITTKESP
jgi:hypothetical protein